jgi:hypothetical protein
MPAKLETTTCRDPTGRRRSEPMGQNTEDLPRHAWKDSLESLTKEREGDDVTIEVLTTDYGDQHTA